MFFKVSNTADKEAIEQQLAVKFRYPELYMPRILINGLGEDNLHIITMEEPDTVQPSIWGLMPDGSKEDWTTFQNVSNTLNVSCDDIERTRWIKNSFKNKRCLLVITGFFTYFLRKGRIYPYYVSLQSEEPFCLGGVYTMLHDGFLSCALLTTKLRKPVSRYHNVCGEMPLAIPESIASEWLSYDFKPKDISKIIKNPPITEYRANPIAKEFFKENIVYESLLQPVYYDEISMNKLD